MKEHGFDIGMYSILGDRSSQQDASVFEWNGTTLLATVCDGMGGMEGGEYASKTGISTLVELMRRQPPQSVETAGEWLKMAFMEANRRVASLVNERGERMNAGSTSVAVMICGSKLQWGCVGDSSIYMMRNAHIEVVTRMHNYNLRLDEMFRRGEIDEEERNRQAARGEALISYLGIGYLPLIDTAKTPITLQKEDIVLLCSDGLYKSLDIEQIRAIIEESGGNMDLAARHLCEEAYRLAIRKQDNTTVIVLRYTGEERQE